MVHYEKDARVVAANLSDTQTSADLVGTTPTIPQGCHLIRAIGNVQMICTNSTTANAAAAIVILPSGFTIQTLGVTTITAGAVSVPVYGEGERVVWIHGVGMKTTSHYWDFAVDVKCHRKIYSGDKIYFVARSNVAATTVGKVYCYLMFVLEFSGHDD